MIPVFRTQHWKPGPLHVRSSHGEYRFGTRLAPVFSTQQMLSSVKRSLNRRCSRLERARRSFRANKLESLLLRRQFRVLNRRDCPLGRSLVSNDLTADEIPRTAGHQRFAHWADASLVCLTSRNRDTPGLRSRFVTLFGLEPMYIFAYFLLRFPLRAGRTKRYDDRRDRMKKDGWRIP